MMTNTDKKHVKAMKLELERTKRHSELVKEAILKRHKITRYIEDFKIAKENGLTMEELTWH
jgi:hypothetical protein